MDHPGTRGPKITHFPFTLVLGGARSGKSSLAERIVAAQAETPLYVATAQAFDDEMRARIAAHQNQRGQRWDTREAPLDLAQTLGDLPPGQPVLVDCATLWLSNLMLAERETDTEIDRLIDVIGKRRASLVLVSNELGLGVVPESALGRAFRDAHGSMNQRLAGVADNVLFVAAGLPLVLKGSLPKGAT